MTIRDIILRHPFRFDPVFYQQSYPDLYDVEDLSRHFVEIGYYERRYGNNEHLQNDITAINKVNCFDDVFYHSKNSASSNPLLHYLLNWQFNKSAPNDQFDVDFIMSYYHRTLAPGENPFAFYCRHQHKDWCFPNFLKAHSATEYLRSSDLLAPAVCKSLAVLGASIDPLIYYCTEGFRSFDTISERFDTRAYMQQYPDIAVACINPLKHYIDHGAAEGRAAFPRANLVSLNGRPFQRTKKTIMIVSHEASRSGAPIVGINLARHLAADYNVISLLLRAGPLVDDFVSVSQTVVVLGDAIGDIISGLSITLSTYDISGAILNSAECSKCLPLLVENSVPTISLIHEFAQYIWHLGFLEKALVLSDAVVFPAEVVKSEALKEFARIGMVPSHLTNLHVRPQGRSMLPPHTMKDGNRGLNLLRMLCAGPDRPFVVLGAGYVQPRKGVDQFIETARIMKHDKKISCLFVWVGSNYRPHEDMVVSVYLADQVVQSGLSDCFLFIDELPALDDLWSMVDAFFMSSRLDPFPNVALDAIAANVPVICFQSATGIAELAERWPERIAAVTYGDCSGAAEALLRLGRAKISGEAPGLENLLSFERYTAFIEELLAEVQARSPSKIAMISGLRESGFDISLLDRTMPTWLKYAGFGVNPDATGKAKVAITAALNGVCIGLLEPGRAAMITAGDPDGGNSWTEGYYRSISADAFPDQINAYSAIFFTNNTEVLKHISELLFLISCKKIITIVSDVFDETDIGCLKRLIDEGSLELISVSRDRDPTSIADLLRRRHETVPWLHLLVEGTAGVAGEPTFNRPEEWLLMARSAAGAFASDAHLQCLFAHPEFDAHKRRPDLMLRCDDFGRVGPLVERMVVSDQVWLRPNNMNFDHLLSEIYISYLKIGDTFRLFHRLCKSDYAESMLSHWALVDCYRKLHVPLVDLDYGRADLSDQFYPRREKSARKEFFDGRIKPQGQSDIVLKEQDLRVAKMLWPTKAEFDWNVIDVPTGSKRLLVHPVMGETTIAVLSGVVSGPIATLSASVVIDNLEASDVEFGIAVVHKRKRYDDPTGLIKEWHRLSPGVRKRINATIEILDDNSSDVLFATRMHANLDPRLAWAYFFDVIVSFSEHDVPRAHPERAARRPVGKGGS